MTLWAWPSELLWPVGVAVLGFSNFVLMTPHERSRSVPAREVLWIFGGLLVFVLLMVASKWWLPHDFGVSLVRVIRHPVLVAILWALVSWLTYRRYRTSAIGEHKAG